ncbi:MAG: SDR family NAD(P)-dependent oxidoreductase [Cyanobacteriota bacterium]|nr:SDR family NAD(P)-dependent oxidoreductase [Cyanobacteriota bacterium]
MAEPKHLVITGATSGIGLEAVKQLDQAGHRLTLICRNSIRGQMVGDQLQDKADIRVADLADLQAVAELADALISQNDSVDVLVLNAGLQYAGHSTPRRNRSGIELTLAVNHLAHQLLAERLAAMVQRVVITASEVHNPNTGGGQVGLPAGLGDMAGLQVGSDAAMADGITPFNADKAYKDSKLCNLLMGLELSRRQPEKPVICWSPGLVIPRNDGGFFRDSRTANPIGQRLFGFVARDLLRLTEAPQRAGELLTRLALDAALPNGFTYWSNALQGPGRHRFGPTAPSAEASDPDRALELWRRSEELIRTSLSGKGHREERDSPESVSG